MSFNPNDLRDIDPGERVLLGPGPSNVPSRVLQAMSAPCIGHLDPTFLSIMDETQSLLRFLFKTDNRLTYQFPGPAARGWRLVLQTWSSRGTRWSCV